MPAPIRSFSAVSTLVFALAGGCLPPGMWIGMPEDEGGEPPPAGSRWCVVADPQRPSEAFDVVNAGDHAVWTCRVPCEGDALACAVPAWDQGQGLTSARDGKPLLALAFVAEGMGGRLIFTADGDQAVILHGGRGGTEHEGGLAALLQAGSLRTIEIVWERGLEIVDGGSGWLTRSTSGPSSFHELSRRLAVLVDDVEHDLGGELPLATVGCSMGATITMAASRWHGRRFAYQLMIGGPTNWDVNIACGRGTSAIGHCDVGAVECAFDRPCLGGLGDGCRPPAVIDGGFGNWPRIVDHVHAAPLCNEVVGPLLAPDPALVASGFAGTVASWDHDTPIDFVIDEGGLSGDEWFGLGHAAFVHASLTGDRRWIDHDLANHCDSYMGNAAAMAATAALVRERLGD